jgi:hypothetical protein
MSETAEPTAKKRLFWVSFRVGLKGGVIEGDLVADSEKLSQEFLQGIKRDVSMGIVRQNGNVIPPGMNDPIILACIELEE